MLGLGEKVIFKIKSGYCLNGLMESDPDGSFLLLTNLGNIYISKVDCLEEKISEYYKYDYIENKRGLHSEIDGNNINVISEELPFTKYSQDEKKTVYMSLIMVLDVVEFDYISRNLKNIIFDLKKDSAIANIDGDILTGHIEKASRRIIFSNYSSRYEFRFEDMEYCSFIKNKIDLKGYFYNDSLSKVVRNVTLISSFSEKFLPDDINSIVRENPKIGVLPAEDKVVFCNVSGVIKGREYLLKNMFLIRHDDLFVFYEKKSKKEILCKEISEFTKIKAGNENYILYDGESVFNVYITDENASLTGIDRLSNIRNKYIGFSKEHRPFFVELDEKNINILKSENRNVLKIDKNLISDISMHEESLADSDMFVETEIKFRDRFVILNLRRNLVTELSSQIFSEYQNSMLSEAGVEEVYENWIKSASDMIIYNFYSNIYELSSKYRYMNSDDIKLSDKIDFVNGLYVDVQIYLKELDIIAVSMTEILENIELKFFKGIGKEFDSGEMEVIERLFFELRNDIKQDISEITGTIEAISYVLLPGEMRKSFVRTAKESQAYQMELFCNQAYSKFIHLIYNMLPHYVSKTVKRVFYIYHDIYRNYIGVNEEDLKNELMERIMSAHTFKQFTVDKESMTLRKEVIEDLYSLMKFSSMKIDSEYYYTGGYR